MIWLAGFRTFWIVKCSWRFTTQLKDSRKQCLQVRFCGFLVLYFFGPCFCSSACWRRCFGQFSRFTEFLLLVPAERRTFPQSPFQIRERFESLWTAGNFTWLWHLWTLSRVFHSLRHVDFELDVEEEVSTGAWWTNYNPGRCWRAGFDTRYWALEYIVTVTSEYAIASGPW